MWVNGTRTQNYTYNAANQVNGWSYDAVGNLLSDGSQSYTYDALGRVLSVGSTSNQYNVNGTLVAQTANSVTTRSTQDLAAPLSQILSDGTQRYVYGNPAERLFAQQGTSPRTWYATDALGSVRATLDDAGIPQAAAMYDAWGVPETPLIGSFGFTGALQRGSDVWLRARWYGAGRGSFGSRDAWVGDAGVPYSMQYYQYAYSAPTVWTDARGENVDCMVTGTKGNPQSHYTCVGGKVVNRSTSIIRIGGAFINKACSRKEVIQEILSESKKAENERYYRTKCIKDNTTRTEAELDFHFLFPGESSDNYAYVDADAISPLRPQDYPSQGNRRLFKDRDPSGANDVAFYNSTWRYHPVNFEESIVKDSPPPSTGFCWATLELDWSIQRGVADGRAATDQGDQTNSWHQWCMDGKSLNWTEGGQKHAAP